MKLSTNHLRIVFATIALWGCFVAVTNAQAPFITTWETTANNESITIPTHPSPNYDYTVDWGDGSSDANVTGDATHTYATAGVYTVSITGTFPRIYFNNGGDKDKLLTIEQWGDIAWISMQYAFFGCSNLQVNAADAPDLTNAPNLTHMFNGATSLNADFNHWDVSGVEALTGMFIDCTSFNGDITGWDVSNVEIMAALFYNASAFNQPIGNWDVSKATNMAQLFFGASSFDQDISDWDVSNVTTMSSMFNGASSFDQSVGHWNIANVSNMSLMLNGSGLSTANYDATLMGWAAQPVQPNVTLDANGLQYCAGEAARDELVNTQGWTITGDSKSTDCGAFITLWETTANNESITIPTNSSETYHYAVDWGDGNGDINITGDATHTYANAGMYTVKITGDFPRIYFANAGDKDKIRAVTQWGDISWTSMVNAFNGCSNLTIDALDAPNLTGATSMLGMFFNATSITGGVAHWDVATITNMYALFSGASAFDEDISGWNVSNVANMEWMFRDAVSFDQDLGSWNIGNVTAMGLMLDNAGLSVANYDATLIGWASQNVQNNVTLGGTGLAYCASAAARQSLIDNYGWTITNDSKTLSCYSPDLFITTWQTTSANETISIPTVDGEAYDYTVDWGDGSTDANVIGDATHTYATAGTYTVTISGTFPRIRFNNLGDREKILSVEQWGSIGWTSMHNAFFGCTNLQVKATDAPDLSGVTSMVSMFENCTTLHADFNHWDVSAVKEMSRLFAGATQFNGGIGNWDMANVTSIGVMFQGASNFNQDISNWDVSNVTSMSNTFASASAFNQPIGNWNVGNVQHMNYVFAGATKFNQPIGGWDVSQVQYMQGLFANATSFNQPIGGWDVSNVTDMSFLFYGASAFDQNIGNWNVSNVQKMQQLFYGATAFNQDISGWNTGQVENMMWMFRDAINFQQNLSGWDVSSVTNLQRMFDGAAKFTSDLGGWDIAQVTDMLSMLDGTFMTPYHYDATLVGWATQNVQPTVALGAQGRQYCASKAARDLLINTHGWAITGDSEATDCGAFVTLWNTTNPGTSNSDQITIPTSGAGYNYDIYWENFNDPSNNGTLAGQTGTITITFPAQGLYRIKIFGDFPHIRFNNTGDRLKLVEINAWGDIQWQSMQAAFWGCENLQLKALDVPDLSQVSDMSLLFAGCPNVNADLSGWEVSNVESFFATFFGATSFNGDVTTWQLDNTTNTASMFKLADQFNQDVTGWNTSNVTDMSEMFYDAAAFDQNLGSWDVESVTTMDEMLRNTALSLANYDATLTGWAAQNVQTGVPLGAQGLLYCAAEADRDALINTHGWTITGDIQSIACQLSGAFITTWETTSANETITIPTHADETYSYTVDWGDGSWDTNVAGNATHTYANAGVYTVSIAGDFPRIYFSNTGDRNKILTVEQWGNIAWSSMENAFHGCSNLQVNATDAPDLSNVTSLRNAFRSCTVLNSDLNHWDVSNVTDLFCAFAFTAAFNGDITGWDVSNVANMIGVFWEATAFNQPIGNWDVGNVTNLSNLFEGATAFNQPIGNWNVANVTQLYATFYGATAFNQSLGNWDVSNVADMDAMFGNATAFNQDLSDWNVSNVQFMGTLFSGATAFDQSLGDWDISAVTDMTDMLNNTGLSEANYDATLVGWATQQAPSGITLGALGLEYCAGRDARDELVNAHGWTITGDSQAPDCGAFVTIWETNNPGVTSFNEIQIPTFPISYNYNVYWEDVNNPSYAGAILNVTGQTTVNFVFPGTYRIKIVGDFPRLFFSNGGDRMKLVEVEQWGDIQWTSMEDAFFGCANMQITATDAPDLSNVTNFANIFNGCTVMNADLNHWDVSAVTQLYQAFAFTDAFNGDITGWDVSNVTGMWNTFVDAKAFNQPIGGWNVSNVTDMTGTFAGAAAFNQSLGDWDIANVTGMVDMLNGSGLSVSNYDATLTGWAAQQVQNGITLGAGGLEYCAEEPRNDLINNAGWTIIGDAHAAVCLLPITGVTFDDASFIYDGTEHVLAISGDLPLGASVTYTNNGRTDVGSQTVTAFVNGGPLYEDLTLTATLTVTQATITGVTFTDVSYAYNDSAHELVIAGTLPSGTSVSYTNNTRTAVGSQTATAEINGGTNYENLTLTATLTVTKGNIAGVTFDDASFTYDGSEKSVTISGSLPSGASVTYADNTRTDAGSQTATAEITGGNNYENLTLTATLTVAKANITGVTFNNATFAYDGSEKTIIVSGTLPVGASVSYTDNTRTNAGSQTAMAAINGGTNHENLTLTATLTITPATHSIDFPRLPEMTYGDNPFTLPATSSGGAEISWTSSDESVAVIEDGQLIVVGAGTTTITGAVPDNPNYSNTPEVSQTLNVAKATQLITFDAPATVDRDAGTIALDASASSGLPVTLSADDDFVARLTGTNQLEILRLGTVRVTATQSGDTNYEAAEPVTVTIRVVDPDSDIPVRVHPVVSPNGDGINDFLIIEAINDYPDNRLYVVNRNGTEVAEIKGYDNDSKAFRGVGSGGIRLPAGTYFYVLEVRDDGQWKHRKGYFILRY